MIRMRVRVRVKIGGMQSRLVRNTGRIKWRWRRQSPKLRRKRTLRIRRERGRALHPIPSCLLKENTITDGTHDVSQPQSWPPMPRVSGLGMGWMTSESVLGRIFALELLDDSCRAVAGSWWLTVVLFFSRSLASTSMTSKRWAISARSI